jgi:hypothetical protein
MDRPRLSLAGRAVLWSAVLLGLVWSGSSALPGTTGAPPTQAAVQATHGFLGGQVHPVVAAARHGLRNRRGANPVAVLAAALAAMVVAATHSWRAAHPGRPDRRLPAVRPRAPPSRRR